MKRISLARRRRAVFLGLLGAALLAACSGGGNSSPAPQPAPTLGGSGLDVPFDQRVNFTVIVPPPTTGSAAAARRRHARSGAAAASPYVSPNTASLTLQIGTVDGQSPRVLPPLLVVNISCPANTGCSVPIQNVPAAKGIDRFAVQTFSRPGGTGNIISSGFIDVTVPSSQATSIGGTTLTVGGYVQSISLALSIPGKTFSWHLPAAGTIDVNAVDPAGAIIIGSDQLANPIQVSLPDTNGGAFTINGSQQLTLQQPAQAIALAYNGTVLFGGTVTASTTDENSKPVATSIRIPIEPPKPTPRPKPTPLPPGQTPPPARSLYVYDAGADRIVEYAGVNDVENGQPFSTTPRRVFEVAAPSALRASLNCSFVSGPGFSSGQPLLESIALSSNGTLYGQTYCGDTATSTQQYTFTYAPSTQEAVPAKGTPTPPPPASTFSVGVPFGSPLGIALDENHNTVWLQYTNTNGVGGNMFGVQMSNPQKQTAAFGSTCLQEFGQTASCASSFVAYAGSPFNFAVDANGYLYLPNAYSGFDADGNPFTPPGDPAEQFNSEPAILVFPPGLNNPAPAPFSALAGFHNELGSTALTDAVEGSTLYSLTNGSAPIPVPGNSGAAVYPGLSGCPAPSASAVPDTLTTLCISTSGDAYLMGFANAAQALTAAGSGGRDVVSPPAFMLGGDLVGGFGQGSSVPGNLLAVRDGFAYVLNPLPSGVGEIDVYNVGAVTGFHTDIPPTTRLVIDKAIVPTSIAIGPTGTGIGGQALLRRPARVHHDLKAWARLLQQRRQALLHRERR